ncbi:hypothetical protein ACR2RQ_003202 [Cronobacter dublinensis]
MSNRTTANRHAAASGGVFFRLLPVFPATHCVIAPLKGYGYRTDSRNFIFDSERVFRRFSRSCDRKNHSVDLCLPGQ